MGTMMGLAEPSRSSNLSSLTWKHTLQRRKVTLKTPNWYTWWHTMLKCARPSDVSPALALMILVWSSLLTVTCRLSMRMKAVVQHFVFFPSFEAFLRGGTERKFSPPIYVKEKKEAFQEVLQKRLSSTFLQSSGAPISYGQGSKENYSSTKCCNSESAAVSAVSIISVNNDGPSGPSSREVVAAVLSVVCQHLFCSAKMSAGPDAIDSCKIHSFFNRKQQSQRSR